MMHVRTLGRLVTAVAITAAVLAMEAPTSNAAVSVPQPGLILVSNSGRATLVVSLCHPGVSVRTTKWGENNRTAQSYANLLGLTAAVNADFFDFPAATKVVGKARGDGVEWPASQTGLYSEVRHYWQFGPKWAQGVIHDSVPYHAGVTDVVGGHDHIIRNGTVFNAWPNHGFYNNALRRTGLGISQDQRWLYITAVNSGAGHVQLAQWMVADAAEAGAPPVYQASNMDGGGSSQLWVNGSWAVSSTRKVANHIGIYTNSTRHSSCRPFYAAEFVSSTLPVQGSGTITLDPDEVVTGTVRFRNTGTEAWGSNTKLAPIPRDQASPLAAPGWLNPSRMSNISGSVAPGAIGTFAVSFKGNTPGTYIQRFGLLHELFTWFAQAPAGGGPADGALKYRVVVNSCAPSCAGKTCGGDGCGGSCGSCGPGTTCSSGQCVCVPQCSGKQCGGDTCGGSCGSCPATDACQQNQCVCQPQCAGIACGADSCGGSCGSCPVQHDCSAGACVCVPDCSGKVCGGDGCGGSCGGCPSWQACDSAGQCQCAPAMEVCDNVDNDCDGSIDEDDVCGGGTCFPGIERPCDLPDLPAGCESGVQRCGDNAFWGACEVPEDCIAPPEPDVVMSDDTTTEADSLLGDTAGSDTDDEDAVMDTSTAGGDTAVGPQEDTLGSPDVGSTDTGGTGVDVVSDLTVNKVPIDSGCQSASPTGSLQWSMVACALLIGLRRRRRRASL